QDPPLGDFYELAEALQGWWGRCCGSARARYLQGQRPGPGTRECFCYMDHRFEAPKAPNLPPDSPQSPLVLSVAAWRKRPTPPEHSHLSGSCRE
uniref:Uncharacterized protein n=1 Tax=Ficedula albicollis TaxID=59894 RepID=A0A803VB03_FICAL